MSDAVYIAGVGMTPFTRHLERSLEDLAMSALRDSLKDSGCDLASVGAIIYSGTTQGPLHGQFLIPGQTVLARAGVAGIPVFNVENACASASSAFHLAVQLVRAGAHDVVLALGAEKMNINDREKELAFFEAGWDVSRAEENLQAFAGLGRNVAIPAGSESTKPFSRFMGIYAAFGRAQMEKYGLTQRQLACVAAKNHGHSVHNPLSQFRRPFTVEEILAAPPIQYPLTLPMCAPISDGAAAAVVCSDAGFRRLGLGRTRAIRILATVVNGPAINPEYALEKSGCHLAGRQAFEQAAIGPKEISVAEVHDATAIGEVLAVERVGIYDDFFELGGHSLLITKVASRIKDKLAIELPLRTLFEVPTIAALSEIISSLTYQPEQDMAQADDEEDFEEGSI